jgi:hypothetical protein
VWQAETTNFFTPRPQFDLHCTPPKETALQDNCLLQAYSEFCKLIRSTADGACFLALRDAPLGRSEEEGSCPASPVFSLQAGGLLDQCALSSCERNPQVIILAILRTFMLSCHIDLF